MELQKEWMEQAWPKEDFGPSSGGVGGNGWDAARMGKALADSVGAWIAYQFPDFDTFKTEEERQMELENVQQGKEEILEEAAGILKDILQELDTRRDERADLDEDEARVIGLTLFKLSDYILPMTCVPKALHLHQPDPNWITGIRKALLL
jgi:tuberous sclerosis protein 2